jgi:hypothetical protein
MNTMMIAHLVGTKATGKIEHILAVPKNALERPSVIVTEDGRTWMWGGEYKHFENTGFYLEVQPAYFSNKMLKVLERAVPVLDRARAA